MTMLSAYRQKLEKIETLKLIGRVNRAVGLIIEANGPAVSVGDLCYLPTAAGGRETMLEVVGFRDNNVLLMPLGQMPPVRAGDTIVAAGVSSEIGVGDRAAGPHDRRARPPARQPRPLKTEEFTAHRHHYQPARDAPALTSRWKPASASSTGMLTVGAGQRIGIFRRIGRRQIDSSGNDGQSFGGRHQRYRSDRANAGAKSGNSSKTSSAAKACRVR
jgi:flagellum-specific ATP synthase